MPHDNAPGDKGMPSGDKSTGSSAPRKSDKPQSVRTALRQRKKELAEEKRLEKKAVFEAAINRYRLTEDGEGYGPLDDMQETLEELFEAPQKKPARRKSKKNLHYPQLKKGGDPLNVFRNWFKQKGWKPWPFQEEAWKAYRAGKDGLIHIPTGAGKTYAAYIGPLSELLETQPAEEDGLQILYVTPLRALTRDIEKALNLPVEELQLPINVDSRTGDTSSSERARQKKNLPHVLITTPESLSLLLSYEDARQKFKGVKAVILDEWHEMLSSKRGIMVELALARLRMWNGLEREKNPAHPPVRTWALSATIANIEEAAQSAAGINSQPVIVTGQMERPITIDTLIPKNVETFPWAGHLGGRMLPQLIEAIDINESTLIFTNVRSHAEKWFMDLLDAKPEWAGIMALHHGSLEREEREFVEHGLKEGLIKLVVCTSSLDLGVDFAPVERVFQIGSPKGVARIIQRAGRAAHRPGAPCRITCVPTHALELVEIAAVRDAIAKGEVEGRTPEKKPYDVLAQHMVTCALGGGFFSDEFYEEVRQTVAYQDLSRDEFDWLMKLVREGGDTLRAYPEYHKVTSDEDGRNVVKDGLIARLHRFNIGTITSDSSMQVIYMATGRRLGTVEEGFLSRLKKGDVFAFAGKILEFMMVKEMVAYVKPAKKKTNTVPRWDGGKLPFTKSLGQAVRETLEEAARKKKNPVPELVAVRPVLEAQQMISRIPKADSLLCEVYRDREGAHLFIFPFEGRFVHEGLAAVLALRMTRMVKTTFQLSVNDYGIEFVTQDQIDYEELLKPGLFTEKDLVTDILESMNMSELARRQFREIARVAGLVYQNYPGSNKTSRQLQASSGIIYDVFQRFDPENLFLQQSRKEVLEKQFEESRLSQTLQRLQQTHIEYVDVSQPSPLAFPLMVERIGSHFRLSSESLAERVEKMKKQWLK